MKRSVFAVALAAAAISPATALASAPVEVTPEAPKAEYRGPAAFGLNPSFFAGDDLPGSCGSAPNDMCDTTRVTVGGPFPTGVVSKSLTFRLDGFENSDYDLRVYKLNKSGARTAFTSPTGDGGGPVGAVLPTGPGDHETTAFSGAKVGDAYDVEIVYFAAVPTETPRVTVTLGK